MPKDAAPDVMPELGLDTLFGVKGKVRNLKLGPPCWDPRRPASARLAEATIR